MPGKKTVDLIPLIDQAQDVVRGRWVVVKNVLHCNDMHGVLRLQLPYQPPEEYDFVVTFSQPRPRNGISLIMPNPRGGSFFCAVGDRGGWGYGAAGPAGKSGSFPRALAANKAYTAMVQVRRDRVRILLDGKLQLEHRTDFRGLTCDGYRDVPDKSLLAVACDDPTVFHYVHVVEVSGDGKKAR